MVFVRRNKDAKEQAFDVVSTLGLRRTKGVVGIEIEVEGRKLPKDDVKAPWSYHHDGSLRGEDNAEYVLRTPLEFSGVRQALDKLWEEFRNYNSELAESNRTSVHIHLNVQEFYLNRLASLMAMYFVFEEILTEWCGEHRVGNLFCLRAKDAPAIVSQIRKFVKSDMMMHLRDHHHYAGLNSNAIHKFGSLEFRALRGVNDPEVIMKWVGVLQRLYEISAEFKDPRELCAKFSSEGPFAFFDQLLGEHGQQIVRDIGWSEDRVRQSMYEGIRLAQDICYSRDWSNFMEIELKPDPFGRKSQTIMKKIQTATATTAVGDEDGFMPPHWEEPEPFYHDEEEEEED